jgi:putative endonuclease
MSKYKYHVYIIECSDASYYTGITGDLERRLVEHQTGNDPKAYTYKRRPVELRFHIEFENVLDAIYFEKRIKGWSRAKKEALISGEFDRLQLLSECRNATHYKYKPKS